jgi:hypothetical protein
MIAAISPTASKYGSKKIAINPANRIHRAAQFEESMTLLVVKVIQRNRLMFDQHRSFFVDKPFEPLDCVDERIKDYSRMGFRRKSLNLCASRPQLWRSRPLGLSGIKSLSLDELGRTSAFHGKSHRSIK